MLKVDESLYDENTEVALGSDMKLEFTSVAGLTQFYVHQCFAYNELPVDNDNYASVVIIENGCAVNADADPEKSIEPQLIDNGQTLAFSQFAFIGQKGTYKHFTRYQVLLQMTLNQMTSSSSSASHVR